MANIPSSSKASLIPLNMTISTPESPPKPKPPILNPIDIIQTFIDQNPDYKVTYELIEAGEEHKQTYQYLYKMGPRVLAAGDVMSKKQSAKRCAAQRTEDVLRSEGYKLCGKSLRSSHYT